MAATVWHERERLERSVSLRAVQAASLAEAGVKDGCLSRWTGGTAYVTPAWWGLLVSDRHPGSGAPRRPHASVCIG